MNRLARFAFKPLPLAISISLVVAGCAGLEPRADVWNAPAVGSTWEIAQQNTGSYGKDVQFRMTRGEGTWQERPAITFANSLGTTTMATSDFGRWHAILGKDSKPIVSWDPPLGWEYPLTVGKTWTTSYRMTLHGKNMTVPYDLSCKVESYGDTTVKAGTFKAFKISCTSTVGTEEIFWMSPELGVFVKAKWTRTAQSPFGPGTQEAELISHSIRH